MRSPGGVAHQLQSHEAQLRSALIQCSTNRRLTCHDGSEVLWFDGTVGAYGLHLSQTAFSGTVGSHPATPRAQLGRCDAYCISASFWMVLPSGGSVLEGGGWSHWAIAQCSSGSNSNMCLQKPEMKRRRSVWSFTEVAYVSPPLSLC